ncbi:hypothetical protein Bca52824_044582 [Brassica carinata]|uniref:Phytocyanin domain-containing protein n=1 Tax=Brassica carinata TaxID=52824 RepID=A0A8X7R932_BRACI|nr:hypothetical protein Bca52824_044582 [Brassica carinata]
MATNGLFKMAAATLLLVIFIVPAAVAVTYTVGDINQCHSGVDYTVRLTGKTFRVGDILEFKYGPVHSVDVPPRIIPTETPKSNSRLRNKPLRSSPPPPLQPPLRHRQPIFPPPNPTHPPPFHVVPPPSPTPPPPSPDTPDLPRSDGIHQADSGSTPPPPPSSEASRGQMSYVVVRISLVLACMYA